MLNLQNKIAGLKKDILVKADQAAVTREKLASIINTLWDASFTEKECIQSLHSKDKLLIITTRQKVFAQELFLRKEYILQELKKSNLPYNQIIVR